MTYLLQARGMIFPKSLILLFTYHEEATVTLGLLKEQQLAGVY